MGKQTFIEFIKDWLAGICWKYFLKLNNLTEDEYFRQIKEQENNKVCCANCRFLQSYTTGIDEYPQCTGLMICAMGNWDNGNPEDDYENCRTDCKDFEEKRVQNIK